MYFCLNNCTSPSNDYTAMECSNNNQAQLHTHVSVPYWSPDVWLGLEMLWDIQFGHLRAGSGCGNPKIVGCASRTCGWTPLSKFLNLPLLMRKSLWSGWAKTWSASLLVTAMHSPFFFHKYFVTHFSLFCSTTQATIILLYSFPISHSYI